jgi:sortase A
VGTRLLDHLIVVLLVTGFGLLSVSGWYLYAGARGHNEGLAAFEAARAARTEPLAVVAAAAPGDEGAADLPPPPARIPPDPDVIPDMAAWSQTRIAAFRETQEAASGVPEGILRIPRVALEVPVFTGTSDDVLNRGAGRIEGTPRLGEPGNTGIAAHRDSWFRVLKDVRVGDEVEVETLDGTHLYRIADLSIVRPVDVHVLESTATDSVTLVTCYPFYFVGSAPDRFIVRAERVADSRG